ncbi:FadR/GntR family transcriptional regulator [Schaalia sp. Marseille-Q2122]|uniref:FadR/GntR family transcriptional regulator n=1 Tax=Schaalia sp. Marseille-Q2122 TaxID=2736604 RepID=UPI00158C5DDE|nr:FCD domain-containing protein [Schaalia sp. Marseille-Q2122]
MGAVDTAREGICQLIASGELKPGQRLPGEVELAAALGVSRGSLREAQRMLAVAGVLEPSGKPVVSDMKATSLMTGLAMVVPLLPVERLLELFPLREVLESYLAAQATARMSDADLDELEALVMRVAALEADDPQAAELDHLFHSLLIQGGGDEMIGALLETIHQRGGDYRVFTGEGAQAFKASSDEGHRRLIAAMRNRDPEGARSLMAEHIRNTRYRLQRMYVDSSEPATQ